MLVSNDTTYLTAEEMAVKLRISLRKLQQLVKADSAPEHIKVGSRLLFVVSKGAAHV